MRFRLAFAVVLMGSLTACNSLLDQNPPDKLPTENSITDARGARAALAGAYNGLRRDAEFYYAAEFIDLGDLSADNVVSTGISAPTTLVDRNQLRANNGSIAGVWDDIYEALNRVNVILEKVPALTDLEETEKNQILGEAYAMRALNLHNLTKFWGDVPMPLVSPTSVEEASQITPDARRRGLRPDPRGPGAGGDAGHRDRAGHPGHHRLRGRAPGASGAVRGGLRHRGRRSRRGPGAGLRAGRRFHRRCSTPRATTRPRTS